MVGGVLSSCALIPPISIGQSALGYTSMPVEVTSGTWSDVKEFEDIEKPSFPISPSAFISVQGFAKSAQVSGTTSPQITITGDSKLRVTISDRSGSFESVTTETVFGPLTLQLAGECGGLDVWCSYNFEDASAASEALTVEIRGNELKKLLRIITEGSATNDMELALTLNTDSGSVAFRFTIEVKENYIKL